MPPVDPKILEQRASFASWADAPDPLGKRKQGATPQQTEFYSQLAMSHERISLMTEQPCTVVNLNPYPLMVLHPLFDGLSVPANKDGEAFSAFVIRSVKYQVNTGVDHHHSPVEFWPVQLCAEFAKQYADKGGVFYIQGDLEMHPELGKTAAFKEAYAAADERLLAYCRKMKQTADNEWATPNRAGQRNIHEPHRRAVKILLQRKLLTKVPEWMDNVAQEAAPECPGCLNDLKKGAPFCPNCNYIVDPVACLRLKKINEVHESWERLTRAQVEAIGISAYVAETADEFPERVAHGLPKPQSAFQIAQQKRLDAEVAEAPAAKARGGK